LTYARPSCTERLPIAASQVQSALVFGIERVNYVALSSGTSRRINNLDPRGMIWTPYPRYNLPSPSSAPLLHQSKTSKYRILAQPQRLKLKNLKHQHAILSQSFSQFAISNFADRYEHLNLKRKTSPSENPLYTAQTLKPLLEASS